MNIFGIRRVHFANSKRNTRAKKLEKLCDLDSDLLMENLSSFSVEAARLLVAMFRNSNQKPKGRRWNFEDRVLALSVLKRSPKSYILHHTLLPLPSRRSLQSILNTVTFRTDINAHIFRALQHSLQKVSRREHYCCLMFDEMSERTYISVRSLTALSVLRIVEVKAGHATLQIML
jgi:hypothetical protein